MTLRIAAWLSALGVLSYAAADELTLRTNALARYLVGDFANAALAPDGARACAIVLHEDGTTAVEVFAWATGNRTTIFSAAPGVDDDPLACGWSSDTRVLVTTERKGTAGHKMLVAVNYDGSAVRELGWYELLSFGPDAPELVTVSVGLGWRWGQIDTVSGQLRLAHEKFDNASRHFIVDGSGGLRALARYTPSVDHWFFLAPDDTRWRALVLPPDDRWYRSAPVGLDAARRLLYIAPKDGRYALFSKGAKGDEPVFAHPTHDVVDIKVLGQDRRVVAAVYFDGLLNFEYFDARVNEVRGLAARSFPGRRLDVLDEDRAQRFYLIRVRGEQEWDEYFRYDTASGALAPLPVDSPSAAERGELRRVSYAASDGTTIPANLFDAAGRAPRAAVILPQLPPLSAHDYPQWDQEFVARYLAANGYLVLQPAVRGTLGRGEPKGDRLIDLPRAAADIADAADFLVHEGLAEPGRVCVVGFGFGGTAALLTAIDRDVLRCVAAAGPLLDLKAVYKQLPRKRRSLLFGADADLDALSPSTRAAQIRVPVQLFHGDMIPFVPDDRSVAQLHAKLVELGKPAELVEYAGAWDDFYQPAYRADFLIRLTEFLDAQLK